ncbi:hypothetical protein [Pseudofrankia sp. BMG5.37]|uniref:hypothetical protein n=1 Tax=Pseudofrankia sp. BMG5.37 TaxID=3050035 RepID=UPI002894DF0B|nr:hypothetical protein [Pseudofrankia sp. BMG5.37]MDT3438353.1 hypothetical protein [Pseudofrankia sp. BMG5.37]
MSPDQRRSPIGGWATRISDKVWRTLRRKRLLACKHIADAAIGAGLDADLAELAGEDGGTGVALVPTPVLCASHTSEIRCPDCHEAHAAATHNPLATRCHMCNALPALVRRHLDVHIVGPVRVWHADVSAQLGGALRLDGALHLCDRCTPMFPQAGLQPIVIDPFPDPARWPWPGALWSSPAALPPPWPPPPPPRKD